MVGDDPDLQIRGLQATHPIPAGTIICAFEGDSVPYSKEAEAALTPEQERMGIAVGRVDAAPGEAVAPVSYTLPDTDDVAHLINQECVTNCTSWS